MREVQHITATMRFTLEVFDWGDNDYSAWLYIRPSRQRWCGVVYCKRDSVGGEWFIDTDNREFDGEFTDRLLYKSTREMRTPDLDKLVDAVMADLMGCERGHA